MQDTTTIIRAAETCIHGKGGCVAGGCHPTAIVPAHVMAAARKHKRVSWTEIIGVGDGYSAAVREGSQLHAWMLEAYRVAAGEERGRLVWLMTPDYRAKRWIESPAYRAWIDRWDALTTPEQRRAMLELEPMPEMGHWIAQTGDALCFLTIDYSTGAIRFVG